MKIIRFVINTIVTIPCRLTFNLIYGASSLKKIEAFLGFRHCDVFEKLFEKTYDPLIMVIYSRTIDILFVAIVVASLHVYIITTWLLTHDPHDSYPW